MADQPTTPSSAPRPGDPEETAPISAVSSPEPGADPTLAQEAPEAAVTGGPTGGTPYGGGAGTPSGPPPYGPGFGAPAGPAPYGGNPAPRQPGQPGRGRTALMLGAAGVLLLLLGGAFGFVLGHVTAGHGDRDRPSMMRGPGGGPGQWGGQDGRSGGRGMPGQGGGQFGNGRPGGGQFGQLPSTAPSPESSEGDDSGDDSSGNGDSGNGDSGNG